MHDHAETVADAVLVGRLPALIALRDNLAERVDGAPDAVVAPIASRLVTVLAEIEMLEEPAEVSDADAAARQATLRAI